MWKLSFNLIFHQDLDGTNLFLYLWQKLFIFPENYLKYAHGIISEYLPEELSKKLSTALGIPAETDLKRKKPQSDVKENKKPKLEKVESEYFADSVTSSNSDSMNEEKVSHLMSKIRYH